MQHGMGGMACPTCGCGMSHHQMGGMGMKGMGGGMKMMFKMLPWKIMMHADELGIREDQMNVMRDKHVEAKKRMIQIGSQKKMAMIDFMSAVMRDDIDMQTAESKAQEVGKLKGEMMAAMVQSMQEMRQILTPDQRKRVKDMVMSWMKKDGMHGMEMEGEEEDESEE